MESGKDHSPGDDLCLFDPVEKVKSQLNPTTQRVFISLGEF